MYDPEKPHVFEIDLSVVGGWTTMTLLMLGVSSLVVIFAAGGFYLTQLLMP